MQLIEFQPSSVYIKKIMKIRENLVNIKNEKLSISKDDADKIIAT